MKRFLVFVAILCMAFLLYAGAQEEAVKPEPEVDAAQSVRLPDTRLDVTIIDGINDKLIKLKGCKVIVTGKLHIVEDSFNYTKTFLNGDRYDITISIRAKK